MAHQLSAPMDAIRQKYGYAPILVVERDWSL